MAQTDNAKPEALTANPWTGTIVYQGQSFALNVTHVSKQATSAWRVWAPGDELGLRALEGASTLTWLGDTYAVTARWVCHSGGNTCLELVCVPPLIDPKPIEMTPSDLRKWLVNDMVPDDGYLFTSEGGFRLPT